MRCKHCGKVMNKQSMKCTSCGVSFRGSKMASGKSRMTAAKLGIFLGPWGVHRFYLGYKWIGVIQILSTVFGIALSPFTCGLTLLTPAWGFVEGVLILIGNFNKDANGHLLKD